MKDLEIITRVMEQHKVILDRIASTSMSMSDKDALLRIEAAETELAVGFRSPLAERREALIKSLAAIENGLKKHYEFEEEMLPPLLGRLLTEALVIEHKSLVAQMEDVVSRIGKINLKGLNRAAEISQEATMSELLNNLRDKKLDHQKREDATLLTLRYICEEKAKRST